MEKKNMLIGILLVAVVVIGIAYAADWIADENDKQLQIAYDLGVQDAALVINQQILNSLQQYGYVPFVVNMTGELETIYLGVIAE